MLLAIAIISGVNYLFSFLKNLENGRWDVNVLTASILVLSTWNSCLPLSIIMMCVTSLIGIIGAIYNEK